MCPDEEHIRETEVALTKMTLERNQKLIGSHSDADEEGSSSENDDERETCSRKSDLEITELKADVEDKNSLPESQQEADDKLVVTISTDDPDGSINNNATIHIETISQDANTIEEKITSESKEDIADMTSEKSEQEGEPENLQEQTKDTDKDYNNAPMLRPECDQIDTKLEKETTETNPFEENSEEENIANEPEHEINTLKTDNIDEKQDNPVSDTEIADCQNEFSKDEKDIQSDITDENKHEEESATINYNSTLYS